MHLWFLFRFFYFSNLIRSTILFASSCLLCLFFNFIFIFFLLHFNPHFELLKISLLFRDRPYQRTEIVLRETNTNQIKITDELNERTARYSIQFTTKYKFVYSFRCKNEFHTHTVKRAFCYANTAMSAYIHVEWYEVWLCRCTCIVDTIRLYTTNGYKPVFHAYLLCCFVYFVFCFWHIILQ